MNILSIVKESLKFCLFFRSGSGVGLDFYVFQLRLGLKPDYNLFIRGCFGDGCVWSGLRPAYHGLFWGDLRLVRSETCAPGAFWGCFRTWWGLKHAHQVHCWGVFVPGACG